MCHSVVVKVGRGGETFPTSLANVRFLARVDPPMCVEAAARGEALLAEITDVGPLPGVDPYVALEQAGPVKHLATGVAGQHALCRLWFVVVGGQVGQGPGELLQRLVVDVVVVMVMMMVLSVAEAA